MLESLDLDIMQIMTRKLSTRSSPDICNCDLEGLQIRLRAAAALGQTVCNSDSDHCGICTQHKTCLRAQVCSFRAAEEGCGSFWILIESTNFLTWISPKLPFENKAMHGVCVCGPQLHNY